MYGLRLTATYMRLWSVGGMLLGITGSVANPIAC